MGLAPETDLAEAVRVLNAHLGLPRNLREMGVTEEVIPRMVEGATADHSGATNPRPAAAADYKALFAEAMG